jgi:cell division protein FtsL
LRSPYAVRRPVENPFLVRQRDRRLWRELIAVFFAVVAIGGCLWLYTWVNIQTTERAYQVNELEGRLDDLRQEERRLELTVAQLTQPRQIEKRAGEQLEMKPPTLAQTLFFEELVP